MDVTGTGIDCFSGCLTTANVVVEGASSICPDGAVTLRFVVICSIVFAVAVAATWVFRRQAVAAAPAPPEKP